MTISLSRLIACVALGVLLTVALTLPGTPLADGGAATLDTLFTPVDAYSGWVEQNRERARDLADTVRELRELRALEAGE